MSDEADRRPTIVAAVLNAAMDVVCGKTVEPPYYFDPIEVRQALTVALAVLVESDPNIRTTKDMREASEQIARDLRVQARAFRARRAQGDAPWDIESIRMQ